MMLKKGQGRCAYFFYGGACSIVLAALIVAAVCVPRVGAASPGTTLRVEPASLEVRPGAEFQVQVRIEDVENLGGFQVELAYDPSVMTVKDVAMGDFLVSTGRSKIPLGPQVNNEEGTALLGAATFGDAPGPDGSGLLATITCVARGEGSSALSLQGVQVVDTGATAKSVEVESGQVVVEEGDNRHPTGAQTSASASAGRWVLIVGAALLAVVGAAVLAFGVLRREPDEG